MMAARSLYCFPQQHWAIALVRWMRALGWVKENICAGVDTSLSQGSVENVKNITVTVDDETYRRARIKAAERDTSVSALVARFLTELATGETDKLSRGGPPGP
jgi:hypothetical protein